MNHQISVSWINPINLSLPKISVYVLILEGRHFLICYAVESTCLSPRSSIHLNWRLSEHLLLTNHQREGRGWKWKLFAPPLCCQSVKPLNIFNYEYLSSVYQLRVPSEDVISLLLFTTPSYPSCLHSIFWQYILDLSQVHMLHLLIPFSHIPFH